MPAHWQGLGGFEAMAMAIAAMLRNRIE